MSIEEIWLILTFCLLTAIASYGFSVIIDDGQKRYRALAGFIWLVLCGAWFALFAYFVTYNLN